MVFYHIAIRKFHRGHFFQKYFCHFKPLFQTFLNFLLVKMAARFATFILGGVKVAKMTASNTCLTNDLLFSCNIIKTAVGLHLIFKINFQVFFKINQKKTTHFYHNRTFFKRKRQNEVANLVKMFFEKSGLIRCIITSTITSISYFYIINFSRNISLGDKS